MDKLRKSVMLSRDVDMELRILSAKMRKPASEIIEEALKQLFNLLRVDASEK
jgi:predicted transcriptional regulator